MGNVEMNMMAEESEGSFVAVLKDQGASTMEELMGLLDYSWGQTFSMVDRLSRSGVVRLTQVDGEYYVEKAGGI